MRSAEILGRVLRLVAAHAPAWFGAAALFTVPLALARPLAETMVLPFWRPLGVSGAGHVLLAIEMFAYVLTWAALVVFVLRGHLGRPGGWSATWNAALGRVRPVVTASLALLWPLFGYLLVLFALPMFVIGLAGLQPTLGPWSIRLGSVCLAVLGTFFSVLILFVVPVAMFERVGGLRAYRRARELLAGNWRLVLGVVAPIVLTGELLTAVARYLIPLEWGDDLARGLLDSASLPFDVAASVLLYVNVRAARESRDADGLVREIDQSLDQVFGDSVYSASMTSSLPPPAPPPGAPPPSDPPPSPPPA